MKNTEIEIVSEDFARHLVGRERDGRQYQPLGRFLCRTATGWTAIDNSTGDAWTVEFETKGYAEIWLVKNNGFSEFERDLIAAVRAATIAEIIKKLTAADGIGSCREAVAVVEKLKVKN